MKITNMRVNNLVEPLGFQISPLSLSWTVGEAGDAKKQKWARIEIFENGSCIYDSGEDALADSLDFRVPVEVKLKPAAQYKWKVTVEADNGEKAEGTSRFETGKMDEEWRGQWISPEDETSSAVLRKRFTVEEPGEARLYMCGLGVYECYINGRKAGDEFLSPGYHSYDFHLQTQTYDVTDLLVKGENEIRIFLGEGWFKGRLGFDGGYTNLYGDRLYAIAELYVESGEERKCVVCTDDTWETCPSPVLFNNIYDGEQYDARREGMDAEGVVLLKAPDHCGKLCDRLSLPIRKKDSFVVKEVIHTPKGDTVLDFGQNLTGWVEFDCDFPAGIQITLTAGEILQQGEFYHDNLRTAKTEFAYISNGKKVHVRPHFTFYGFRYMKVDCPCEVTADMFTAYHLRSDFDQIGWIETGNRKVDQLFSNALWGMKDNLLDVPTDCPQRDERLGWTGDAQAISETACYSLYMPAFYRKYLWDMRAEQSILDGAVPNVVPRIKEGMVSEYGSCPWADAGVIIPWNTYLHYGNKTLLAETYSGMKDWVDYQRKQEEAQGGPHLIKGGFHFADWLALDHDDPAPFGATDPLYIASAYYYRCADIVAQSAEALGYGEAEEYRTLAGEILSAIREKYFDEKGLCVCPTQTGSALAIQFGLSEKIKEEGDVLEQRIRDNKGHLNTGFVGTPILCQALTKSGHHKTAVDLLLNEDYPGWLYSVNLGATTIWERWNSVLPDGTINPEGMNSLNHYTYGSIEAWMFADVCGIRAGMFGFREAVIEPHPDRRLGYLRGRIDTAAGAYESSWEYRDGKIYYEIKVPFGASAQIILPGEEPAAVTAGTYTYERNAE